MTNDRAVAMLLSAYDKLIWKAFSVDSGQKMLWETDGNRTWKCSICIRRNVTYYSHYYHCGSDKGIVPCSRGGATYSHGWDRAQSLLYLSM